MDISDTLFSILRLTEPSLTVDEKYLLVCIVLRYQDGVVRAPMKELRGALGLRESVLAKARDGLVQKGLVVMAAWHDQELGGAERAEIGRPMKSFRLSPQFQEKIGSHATEVPANGVGAYGRIDAISTVLTMPKGRVTFQRGRGRSSKDMQPVGRVLLSVLLVLADQTGVIREVGLSELASMVGVKKERLEYQLEKLLEAGYLRAWVPGATGRLIFGQVSGLICLNLQSGLPGKLQRELLICCEDGFIPPAEVFRLGYDIIAKAKSETRAKRRHGGGSKFAPFNAPQEMEVRLAGSLKWVKELLANTHSSSGSGRLVPGTESADGFLNGKCSLVLDALWESAGLGWLFGCESEGMARCLQTELEGFASLLLTEHFQGLARGPLLAPAVVYARVTAEVVSDSRLSSFLRRMAVTDQTGAQIRGLGGKHKEGEEQQGKPSELMTAEGRGLVREALSLYLYLLSFRMAHAVWGMLLQHVPWHDLKMPGVMKSMERITILPFPNMASSVPASFAVSIVAPAVSQLSCPAVVMVKREAPLAGLVKLTEACWLSMAPQNGQFWYCEK